MKNRKISKITRPKLMLKVFCIDENIMVLIDIPLFFVIGLIDMLNCIDNLVI